MSRQDLRDFVLRAVEDGPVRTSDLITSAREKKLLSDGDDELKAAVWDLAERGEVFWARDGRIEAMRASARA